MTYRIRTFDGKYHIFETTTGFIIYSSPEEDKVKSICRFLNSGGGFNGATPTIFCHKVDIID